jgi:hypothetical protein
VSSRIGPYFKEDNIFSLKNYVFWNITPCNLLKVNRRFRGTCRLHLQGRGISQTIHQHEVSFCLFHSYTCTILWSNTEVLKLWCVSYVSHGHGAELDQLREVSVLNSIQMEPDLFTTCFMVVSCFSYCSTLKMEATCSFETSVYFQRTTRHYIP